jgi:acyl-[acyl carrier protein]--UDP-N-acetylglucosamine O-acyltransferase
MSNDPVVFTTDVSMHNNLVVGNGLTVTGATTLGSTLRVSGATTLGRVTATTTTTTSDTNAKGRVFVDGSTLIRNNLTVTGVTSLGTVSVGSLTVSTYPSSSIPVVSSWGFNIKIEIIRK